MLCYRGEIETEEYLALRRQVGWDALPAPQAQAGLRHSWRVVCCREGGRAVGFARLLWDQGGLAYLGDVMVAPLYQGRGVGSRMVGELMGALRGALPPGWQVKVILLAVGGKEPFYQRFGFLPCPNEHSGAGMALRLQG